MRTLPFGLRVSDLDRSLEFYAGLGYEVVGSVPDTPLGHLTMLKLPGDEFVTIELVHNPGQGEIDRPTGLTRYSSPSATGAASRSWTFSDPANPKAAGLVPSHVGTFAGEGSQVVT